MKTMILSATALAAIVAVDMGAQAPTSSVADPRVGLKAGLRNAGVAARNMELVASLPKPRGFFDPESPGGRPSPAEPEGDLPATDPAMVAYREVITKALSFATSDLAFSGN